jgi:hypothetical protein
MTTAQCIFVVWVFLGVVTGGCFAAFNRYDRGISFGMGVMFYLGGSFVVALLGFVFNALGQP